LNESGGHRWQRVPPTERNGRVHTSTVTVVVMEELEVRNFKISDDDISIKFSRGTGPGGQHKNKTDSCVHMTHIPTGLTARIDGRSQHQNKEVARKMLEGRVAKLEKDKIYSKQEQERKDKAGSGQRGDKIRTYRVKDDMVQDHRTESTTSLKKVLSGCLEF
jgi:peptide chain release factor 1